MSDTNAEPEELVHAPLRARLGWTHILRTRPPHDALSRPRHHHAASTVGRNLDRTIRIRRAAYGRPCGCCGCCASQCGTAGCGAPLPKSPAVGRCCGCNAAHLACAMKGEEVHCGVVHCGMVRTPPCRRPSSRSARRGGERGGGRGVDARQGGARVRAGRCRNEERGAGGERRRVKGKSARERWGKQTATRMEAVGGGQPAPIALDGRAPTPPSGR